MQDIQQDIPINNSVETDLMKGLQDLTLKENKDMQNLTNMPVPLPEVPEKKRKTEDKDGNRLKPSYEMTKWELRLQEEERKYEIYMSTFGYEGDDSYLISEMDTDSYIATYPYLD